jgi:hypothetical protein
MTKQEKFLLLVVFLVAGVGATIYVSNQKESEAVVSQVQSGALNLEGGVVNTAPVGGVSTQGGTTQTGGSGTVTTGNTSTVSRKDVVVTYGVPNGETETLSVFVTTNGGVISDITFAMTPTNPTSAQYFNGFKNSFPKSQIVGKTLNDISLSRVGGASLTTNAFNKAIGELRG